MLGRHRIVRIRRVQKRGAKPRLDLRRRRVRVVPVVHWHLRRIHKTRAKRPREARWVYRGVRRECWRDGSTTGAHREVSCLDYGRELWGFLGGHLREGGEWWGNVPVGAPAETHAEEYGED